MQEVRHGLDLRASSSRIKRPRGLIRKHGPFRANPYVSNISQQTASSCKELDSKWIESQGLASHAFTGNLI